MWKKLTICLVGIPILYVGFDCAGLAYGEEAVVFGPKTFTRGTGAPLKVVMNFSVNLPLQDFTISVQNGEGRPGRVSSAIVELNGLPVVGPNEFNKQLDLITKPVFPLQGQNSLAVELRSAPGTSIIVTILGRFPSVTEIIPPEGGTVNLNGLASVTFPNGAFTFSNTVKVSASNSPATQEDFSATAEGPRLPYEIRINAGDVPPVTSFDVVFNVPESFANSIAPDHQLEIFAQPIESGEIEALGHFRGFPSVFDSVNNSVRATLPPEAFTNESSLDGSYEAILIVGDIPKYPPVVGTQSSTPRSSGTSAKAETMRIASLNLMGLLAGAAPICEGSPLGSPLEGDLVVRDPFNPPSHDGVDYRAPLGTNVHPVAPGKVTKVGFDLRDLPRPNPRTGLTVRGYGRYVIITHQDGSQTRYAHLIPDSTNHLVEGVTEVSTTDVIGQAGQSGGVTGPHLHLEYSPGGRILVKRSLVDPHPCVLAGQAPPEPLVLSPQNPTLTCPSGSVTFTASGGVPPYNWKQPTKGVLTVSGANNQTATLRPPFNNQFVSGVAYVQVGQSAEPTLGELFDNQTTCSARITGFVERRCDGSPGLFLDLFNCAHQYAAQCGCGPLVCENASFCADPNLPFCEAGGSTAGVTPARHMRDHPDSGFLCDVRTQAMRDASCKPCMLEMQGGATVTVEDSAKPTPASQDTTVTVQ